MTEEELEARLDRVVERLASAFDGPFWCGLGQRLREAWKGIGDYDQRDC